MYTLIFHKESKKNKNFNWTHLINIRKFYIRATGYSCTLCMKKHFFQCMSVFVSYVTNLNRRSPQSQKIGNETSSWCRPLQACRSPPPCSCGLSPETNPHIIKDYPLYTSLMLKVSWFTICWWKARLSNFLVKTERFPWVRIRRMKQRIFVNTRKRDSSKNHAGLRLKSRLFGYRLNVCVISKANYLNLFLYSYSNSMI